MKTVRLVKNLMVIGMVLAAVTACGQKEKTAKFRGARTNGATSIVQGAQATDKSNYGRLSGYNQAQVVNFLGAQDGELGAVSYTNSTDVGVFIVGRLIYSQATGILDPSSIVEVVVRDQGYQSKGGEFQSDFTNCTDSSYSATQIIVTCSDNAGSVTISGTLSSTSISQAILTASISFTTEGFPSGSLGQFQMRANALMSLN